MPRFGNPSISSLKLRDIHKCGRPKRECRRPKRECRRYISEAALRFGNLCVYESSALWKKTSPSSQKPSNSWKEPSDLRRKSSCLRWRCAANIFRIGVLNHSINFNTASLTLFDPVLHTCNNVEDSHIVRGPYLNIIT